MHITKREISIIIALACFACLRFFFFTPKPPTYANAVNKIVTVVGKVTEPPDIRLNNQHITLTPKGQKSDILLTIPTTIAVSYGDTISAHGVLTVPENFVTSSGKEFDYQRYLAAQNIYYVIKNAHAQILSHGNGNWFVLQLYRFRNAFMDNVSSIISSPESDLGNGLVLGARGGFDNKERDEFIATGTIHIVALSGYNVTIVAEGIMKLLGIFLSGSISSMFGIFVVIVFIIMAGSSSTAIRAGIMTSIALLGRMTGRTYNALRGLIIAGLLMITYDPRVFFDISFELSFLATFGVLCVTPKILRYLTFLPMRFGFRENVATTISATIAVLPVLLYSTGILSLVSLPANILILPFIPLTMLMVFLTGMTGFISHGLSYMFGYIAHLLLAYILMIIHFFAALPFASIIVPVFPLVAMIFSYAILLWWVVKKNP